MTKATARDVAAWFSGAIDRESGESITHLKIQKLVYYAQAWSLALREKPIFDEDMKAWAHGPVAESVYREYEGVGWNALPPPAKMPHFDEETTALLENILGSYGNLSAKQLENMTHVELPWIEARGNLPPEARSNTTINKETMKLYYKKLYEESESEKG